MDAQLIDALIHTQAVRIAPPGELFWYTSGTVGPYYINGHYLFGGPDAASELLAFIDAEKGSADFGARLRQRVCARWEADPVYRGVIDRLAALVRSGAAAGLDCVSGGERRDWFFSAAVAEKLGVPHLVIAKDATLSLWDRERAVPLAGLEGRRAAHVADMVTEASSYLGTWIPAVQQAGGRMVHSANVVDRGQGGLQAIRGRGVPADALICVDEPLFAHLRASGVIDEGQRQVFAAYFRDPHGSMREFLRSHPDFLRRALQSTDARTSTRARTLVEQNLYDLDLQQLLG